MKKEIKLYTDAGFEVGAIELLTDYEPGPIYVLATETPDGPGVFLCNEPFTMEEAEAQYPMGPTEDAVGDGLVDDVDDSGSDLVDDDLDLGGLSAADDDSEE